VRNMATRLDAFLSHRGFGSRSQVRALIRSGRVKVSGTICREQGIHVDEQVVRVDDQSIDVGVESATLIFNKPLGYACSHDPAEAPLIEEFIPEIFRHLPMETAGRLDRDTSGLLMVTSDGNLIHALTNPRRHLEKRYRITYAGRLSAHAVKRCAKGMILPGDPKPTLPALLELDGVNEKGQGLATLYLHEGRYHQVRRMIAELGGEVVALHRDRIGGLSLPPDLLPGHMREISTSEFHALMHGSEKRTENKISDHQGDEKNAQDSTFSESTEPIP
jgi:16S rRNA pseudouridine516 synthase